MLRKNINKLILISTLCVTTHSSLLSVGDKKCQLAGIRSTFRALLSKEVFADKVTTQIFSYTDVIQLII